MAKLPDGNRKSQESCKTSNHAILDHFVDANKMMAIRSGTKREIEVPQTFYNLITLRIADCVS